MIPRVFPQWVDEQKMIDIFDQQHIGKVYKVSIIRMPDSKKRNYPIYKAFIYFSAWYENEIAYNFQQRILGDRGQARVVYDDPWFWVVFENTQRRLSNADKRMIRLGQKAYAHEQYLIEQEERLRLVEEKISRLILLRAALNESPPPRETETVGAANAVLNDAEVDISDNIIRYSGAEWFNSPWLSHQQGQLESAAAEILGEEMALTDTAINVAEAALKETNDGYDTGDEYEYEHYYNYYKYSMSGYDSP
jgi:hypothetical protein